MSRRVAVAGVAGLSVGALAAHWAPSVLVLGQWAGVRRLPGGRCAWRGPARLPRVALTFDDGPDPEATPALLERLDALAVPATFFCLGTHVERSPGLVADAVARGHQVELHGHEHGHHLLRPPGWVRRDLDAAVRALNDVGVSPRWLRPPYGQVSGATVLHARRHGLRLALWSAWGREWSARSPAEVAERVLRAASPGAVILLHDSDASSPHGSARRALEALGPIIDGLRSRGLEPATLDDVVAA